MIFLKMLENANEVANDKESECRFVITILFSI